MRAASVGHPFSWRQLVSRVIDRRSDDARLERDGALDHRGPRGEIHSDGHHAVERAEPVSECRRSAGRSFR
jgi:hypothetical protein